MNLKTGYVITPDDTPIYYELSGILHAPTITLLHGFSLDQRMWDDQEALLRQRFSVLRYDLRGFGKSSVPRRRPYKHQDDLKMLLDHLGIEKSTLMGLSMGGQVALDFAVSYQERVTSLIVSDTSLSGGKKTINWGIKGHGLTLEEAFSKWLNHPLFEYANRDQDLRRRLSEIVRAYSGWHWYNTDPLEKLVPTSATQIKTIKIPTLVVIGQYDLTDFKQNADFICNEIKHAKLAVLAEAGHLANMEKPKEYNDIIMKFLQEVYADLI